METDFIEGRGEMPPPKNSFTDDRIKSSHRMIYEAQVKTIQEQLGTLEDVRLKLGLSQRKMCQLLMVDPSAWTRWTKTEDQSAPPHIWRALQWYLALKKEIPGLNEHYFLSHEFRMRDHDAHKAKLNQLLEQMGALNQEISLLKQENTKLSQRFTDSHAQAQKRQVQQYWIGAAAAVTVAALFFLFF